MLLRLCLGTTKCLTRCVSRLHLCPQWVAGRPGVRHGARGGSPLAGVPQLLDEVFQHRCPVPSGGKPRLPFILSTHSGIGGVWNTSFISQMSVCPCCAVSAVGEGLVGHRVAEPVRLLEDQHAALVPDLPARTARLRERQTPLYSLCRVSNVLV